MFTLRQTGIFKVEHGETLTFRSLLRVRTPPAVRRLATAMMALFFLGALAMLFVPWRQSVYGAGEIIVFSPMQRPQDIEAQISGRLVQWYLRDGQLVKKGQLIARLSDIDPRFLNPAQLDLLLGQKQALVAKRDEAETKAEALARQWEDTKGSRGAAVPAASEKISQARGKAQAAQLRIDKLNQEELAEKQRIRNEVLDAVSAVNLSYEQFLSREQQVKKAEAVYLGERERFKVGDSTVFLVTQRERQLNEARLALIDARREYEIGLVALRIITCQI